MTEEAPLANDRLRQIADKLAAVRAERDKAKAVWNMIVEDHDRLERELFDAIEDAGLQSIRTPVGLFSLSDLAWPMIEDRDQLIAWAEAEHPEFLTLNLQRLQTPLREALKLGQELPPGLGYNVTRKIRLTAAKGG